VKKALDILKKFSWIIWVPLFIYFDLMKFITEEIFIYLFYPLTILLLIYDIYKEKKTVFSTKRTGILLETNNDSSNKIGQLILGSLFSIGIVCLFLFSDFNSVPLSFFLTLGFYSIYKSTYINKSLSIAIEKEQLVVKILPNFEKIICIDELSQLIFSKEDIIFVKKNGKKNAIHFLNISDSEKSNAIQFLTKTLGNDIQIT